ncbi:MAG: NAD(P)/FAD-dependent oxidoreductase [Gammaproteobacteria bacterium]|nr:NAD(P)/FAD-dependent oxidoreductase [Gammaproteobacteria bacterium]
MTEYDVMIVGGGPAGSTLAWYLRDSGLKVAILDKASFPRDKTCAGWVTPEVMQELQIDLSDYQQHNTLQSVNGFRISHMGGKEVDTPMSDKPVSYGIRRSEFDNYLLQRCGAELILNTKFSKMEKQPDGWLVNDNYKAKLVVGAGGHFCPVARAMGARPGSAERTVVAQEIEYAMTAEQMAECSVSEEVPELFFCKDLEGYGWVVRKGNYLNIGLGREDTNKLTEHVAEFSQMLKKQRKIPSDTPDKFPGHAYLLYPHAIRELIQDGVMLIGDAAGLAYPQSGEGIRPAVESAMMAAKVIRDIKGQYSQQNLQPYYRQLTERFGQRQPTPDLMERLPQSIKELFAHYLLGQRWFAQHVVMDRWFLHKQQAPLVFE